MAALTAPGVARVSVLVELLPRGVEAHRVPDGDRMQLGEHDPQWRDRAQLSGQAARRHESNGRPPRPAEGQVQ